MPTPIHTAGATDPKIGNLSGNGGTVVSVVTVGNTTTITYVDTSRDVIVRVVNADGSVTTTTTHFAAGMSTGTVTSIKTTANSKSEDGNGGLYNQNAIGYKRISWKELIRN
jgi:hypothetical protein